MQRYGNHKNANFEQYSVVFLVVHISNLKAHVIIHCCNINFSHCQMEYFQDDLFPDTRVWWEPALTSDKWFAGENGTQRKMSLRPDGMKPCMPFTTLV